MDLSYYLKNDQKGEENTSPSPSPVDLSYFLKNPQEGGKKNKLGRYQFSIRHLLYAMLATSAFFGLPKLKEGVDKIQAHREKVRACIYEFERVKRANDQPEMDAWYSRLKISLTADHVTPDEIGLTPEIEAELQSKRATLPTIDPLRQAIEDMEKLPDRM